MGAYLFDDDRTSGNLYRYAYFHSVLLEAVILLPSIFSERQLNLSHFRKLTIYSSTPSQIYQLSSGGYFATPIPYKHSRILHKAGFLNALRSDKPKTVQHSVKLFYSSVKYPTVRPCLRMKMGYPK